MAKLKGAKPETKEKRLKLLLFGPAGSGKTVAAIQFPNAYIIDTEKGTDNYAKSINDAGSVVYQTCNPDEIHDEIQTLLTVPHDYRTLVIDPITMVYNACQEKWNMIFAKHTKNAADKEIADFGMRYWGKVKSNFKAIQRLILQLDMNVIITAHQKDVYGGNFSKIGVSFDSMKGDDYFFDLIFRLQKNIDNSRTAYTLKERDEVGCSKFPEKFLWSYENFLTAYGKDIIERKAETTAMAKPEDVERVELILKSLVVDDTQINKWFSKANVESFAEMTDTQIKGCLKLLEKKVKEVNK